MATRSGPGRTDLETTSASARQLERLRAVIRAMGAVKIVFFTLALLAAATRTEPPGLLYDLFGWGPVGDAEEVMISAVYIVWGLFLWTSATDPVRHRLFLDFTIAANAAHFGAMFIQALLMEGERIHLVGDVLVGWVLLIVLASAWLPVRSASGLGSIASARSFGPPA